MVSDDELNALFSASWPDHSRRNFEPILEHSLSYICAYLDQSLVGFVNVAWDGGIHAFILDTTVHPRVRRQGVGTRLVKRAAQVTADMGITWLHVDYEPSLEAFYRGCGFQPTLAGLIRLSD